MRSFVIMKCVSEGRLIPGTIRALFLNLSIKSPNFTIYGSGVNYWVMSFDNEEKS